MMPIVKVVLLIVMSFNIRLNNPGDGINSWDNRKEIVTNLIEEHSPDLLGMQEVRGEQLSYLDEHLTEYNSYSQPRTEDPNDEASPIFFKKDKFELINSDTFWLSETPDKPSKGWDAAFNRIVTWCKLKDRETGKTFFYFNTHFDHIGEQARLESVKLLKKKVKEITGSDDYIITGDFNSDPSSKYYNELISLDTSSALLMDVSQFSEETKKQIKGTFNSFDSSKDATGPIDYIFVKPTTSVESFEVIDTLYNGRFPSDHFPVKALLELNAE
jgi:endonuclease/exonuclease/phosphatase family metal-dependent hydrolase